MESKTSLRRPGDAVCVHGTSTVGWSGRREGGGRAGVSRSALGAAVARRVWRDAAVAAMASCSCSPPLFSLGQGHVNGKGRRLLAPILGGVAPEGRWWSSCPSSSHNLSSRQLVHLLRCSLRLATRDGPGAIPNQRWERRRAPLGTVFCNVRETGVNMTGSSGGDDLDAGGSRGIQLYSQIERYLLLDKIILQTMIVEPPWMISNSFTVAWISRAIWSHIILTKQ